jgi:ligand-binding sensor domain-containing protein
MKKMILLSFLIFCPIMFLIINAQSDQWKVFFSIKEIHALADENDVLWVGTDGGLVRMNIITGEMTHFNTSNSCLTSNRVYEIVIDGDGRKWVGTVILPP